MCNLFPQLGPILILHGTMSGSTYTPVPLEPPTDIPPPPVTEMTDNLLGQFTNTNTVSNIFMFLLNAALSVVGVGASLATLITLIVFSATLAGVAAPEAYLLWISYAIIAWIIGFAIYGALNFMLALVAARKWKLKPTNFFFKLATDGKYIIVLAVLAALILVVSIVLLCVYMGLVYPTFFGKVNTATNCSLSGLEEFSCQAMGWCADYEAGIVMWGVFILLGCILCWLMLGGTIAWAVSIWRTRVTVFVTLVAELALAGLIFAGFLWQFIYLWIASYDAVLFVDRPGRDVLYVKIGFDFLTLLLVLAYVSLSVVYFVVRFLKPMTDDALEKYKRVQPSSDRKLLDHIRGIWDSFSFIPSFFRWVILSAILFFQGIFAGISIFIYYGYSCLDNVALLLPDYAWCTCPYIGYYRVVHYLLVVGCAILVLYWTHVGALFIADVAIPVSYFWRPWKMMKPHEE